ncbi:SusD/RagB family nutrient-binding outer membrane lipoprotein [Prevotella sp. MA2016]|uniref:SusD/RagB family nutrient-binding outer membrane lipoprotein n=1 Tax=Prevotella sp. MA2016 TaxID=1408310 RepID=UPI000490DB5E|nr:SusD/RagB family nutrient-binding outer membrane lipoprotein [Prevotella sp. MA2016]
MKKFATVLIFGLGLAAASCDSYLDINEDPNSPATSNLNTSIVLPAAEMNIVGSYGDFARIYAGYYAQYYSQTFGTSNYLDLSQFTMSATRSSSFYTQLNQRGLKNLETVRELAKDNEEWGTYLAATTLRAFTYQVLVDCYGEVPYTEAFQSGITSPNYDDGATIYNGIVAELDEALSLASPSDPVATNFLYKGETAANWIKFANALKLKILSRESGVANVDSQIGAIISEGNLPDSDVAYAGIWGSEPGSMNPFYAEEFSSAWGSTQINVVANLAIIGTMLQSDKGYEDGRLAAFFEKNGSGNYTGGVSGTNFSTSGTYKLAYWCRPVASDDMPVYYLTLSEIEFFIAEYYARQGNAAQAEAHYNAAIKASFATAGAEGAEEAIAMFPYDQNNYKKSIGISKWIALAGVNTFEGWCEMRRLDYPTFGTLKGSDIYNVATDEYKPEIYVPGTLYTPIMVDGKVGDNHLLERWIYPESSSARNGNSPEFPGYTSPVFWGK